MADRTTIDALTEALEDEYRARATYRKVIECFGPMRPFVNIVEAENRHVAALLRQFRRLGAQPPVARHGGASLRRGRAGRDRERSPLRSLA